MLMMDSEEKENCLKTIEKDEMRENKRDRGNNNSSTIRGVVRIGATGVIVPFNLEANMP